MKNKPAPCSIIKSEEVKNNCKGDNNLRMQDTAVWYSVRVSQDVFPCRDYLPAQGHTVLVPRGPQQELILLPNLRHCP